MLLFSASPDSVVLLDRVDAQAAGLGFPNRRVLRPRRPFESAFDSVLMAQYWEYDRVQGEGRVPGEVDMVRTSGTFGFSIDFTYQGPDSIHGSGIRFVDVVPPDGFPSIEVSARRIGCQ